MEQKTTTQFILDTTTSIQALVRLIKQKTERKNQEIERLENEARKDIVDGIKTMEILLQRVETLSSQAIEEQRNEMEILMEENILLQKKNEAHRKEIEILQSEIRKSQNEKHQMIEEHSKKIEEYEKMMNEKENEISNLENEVFTIFQQQSPLFSTTDEMNTNLMILKCQLDKKNNEIEELYREIKELRAENENLKNASEVNAQTSDVMWMTIIKGRNENNALRNRIDELLRGVGPSEADMFDGYVQRGELDEIKKWTGMKRFKKVCVIEGESDTLDWHHVKGKRNVLCIKVTQIGSVFGYFHRKEHPPVDNFILLRTTELLFSLRNLFNRPPLILKKNDGTKLVEVAPTEVSVPIITEEADSPPLCCLLFVGEEE